MKNCESSVNVWSNQNLNKTTPLFDSNNYRLNMKNNSQDIIKQLTNIQQTFKSLENEIQYLKSQEQRIPELEAKIEEMRNDMYNLLTTRIENIENYIKETVKNETEMTEKAKQLFDKITNKKT